MFELDFLDLASLLASQVGIFRVMKALARGSETPFDHTRTAYLDLSIPLSEDISYSCCGRAWTGALFKAQYGREDLMATRASGYLHLFVLYTK